MKPERWKEIDELVQDALERPPEDRGAFLDQACAHDDSLRKEVESVLSYQPQASEFLEQPVVERAAELIASPGNKLSKGTSIGHYQIVDLLGEGGMGEVYLARDTKLGRNVALKLLPQQFMGDSQRVRRFEQEASAASALNQPNIVTIYEIGKTSGIHYIATEFIEGQTLRECMSAPPMTIEQIVDIGGQIGSALAAAHDAGIVHRDIKPENIMVRRDGLVKVLDFGLAKLIKPQSSSEATTKALVKTGAGVVMGTVRYMSPEQARGLELDARTDIWSLGCVLYELVAGRLPFDGATPNDVISLILQKEAPSLTRYSSDTPPEFDRIVTKSLRKNPDERYQVIKDLVLDLKSFKRQLEFEAERERSATPERVSAQTNPFESRPTSSAEYLVGEFKQHKRATLLALGALLILILIASFAVMRFMAKDNQATSASGSVIGSIAVMPFVNTSGNSDADYLSDGISESLINSLSQLPGVKVIARSSSFKYKGNEINPQEVAKALGVDGIVTGRVTQRGDNILISVELVNARDQTNVWGEQYNRPTSDVLAVQSDISREIAEKLRLHLTAGEQRQLAKRETVHPQAYELVLKGRFYRYKGGTEDRKRAAEYFKQAIVIDPNYAVAYAGLAATYFDLIGNSSVDPKEFAPQAQAAVRKALELDEALPEAHSISASLKRDAWQWEEAERAYRRAIELNPNFDRAHSAFSYHLSIMRRHDEAIAEAKRGLDVNPLSPYAYRGLAYALFFARRTDEAIEVLKKVLELEGRHPTTHNWLGYAYAQQARYKEAIAEHKEAIKAGISPDNPNVQIYMGAAYAKAGDRAQAQAILRRLEMSQQYVSPGELPVLYAALGDKERAFASLEKAYAAHDMQLQYLGVDPALDPLRSDPRFSDLMRRVGLTR